MKDDSHKEVREEGKAGKGEEEEEEEKAGKV